MGFFHSEEWTEPYRKVRNLKLDKTSLYVLVIKSVSIQVSLMCLTHQHQRCILGSQMKLLRVTGLINCIFHQVVFPELNGSIQSRQLSLNNEEKNVDVWSEGLDTNDQFG